MRSSRAATLAMMVICMTSGLWVGAASPPGMLTLWEMPYDRAFPGGLAVDDDGMVYVAASGGREVYRLDPMNNLYRGWGVGERPQDVMIADGVVFCTVQDGDSIVFFDPDGLGVTTAAVPFPGVGPREIHRGPDNSQGKLIFWVAEWNAAGVLCYEYDPVVDAPVAVGSPSDQATTWTVATAAATVRAVEYEQFAYDVTLIPDPVPLPATRTANAFSEWSLPIGHGFFLSDIAAADDGMVWISFGAPFLYRLDPAAGSIQVLETIQNVAIASGLLPASDGSIWFGNILEGSIGHLDPALGLSEVWRIPGTGEVYDLVFGPDGAIWYTDRVENAIGRLDVRSNEATVYRLPEDSEPLYLAFDANGALWFSAGSGNYIGRLTTSVSF